MQPTDHIFFESRDTEIFNIPDTKTKLDTLQNYFFPRLQRLLDMALELVKEVYDVDPLNRYSFVRTPAHRKDAKINRDYDRVTFGIAGRRDPKRQLAIKREDGTNFAFHPSHLLFKLLPTGEMYVELSPFSYYVDDAYILTVKQYLAKKYTAFSVLMNVGKLSYKGAVNFNSVADQLKDKNDFQLASASHYFPIENQKAIYDLVLSFVLLFPILDACYHLAEGKNPTFTDHFDKLKAWLADVKEQSREAVEPNKEMLELPELDSYKFVRAGLWYQVLARDSWTCCSCKRSAKEHGIVLHVDHILPRSLGGKDESNNLQTLCLKCNIGKSNKDATDLRG